MQVWKHIKTKTPFVLVENTCGVVELYHSKGNFSRVMSESQMLSNFSSKQSDDISNDLVVVSSKPHVGVNDLIEDIKEELKRATR